MGTAAEMYRVWGQTMEEAEWLQRFLQQFTSQERSKNKTGKHEPSSHH